MLTNIFQIVNMAISGVIAFVVNKNLNKQSQQFNNRLERLKFQNSNIQLNALKHVELITTSRIKWIQEVRENISILLAKLDIFVIEINYVYDICIISEITVENSNKNISELLKNSDIFYYINKISLQLNEKDYETDKKLIDSLEKLELEIKSLLAKKTELKYKEYSVIAPRVFIEEIKKLKIEIKEKSREILKKEWERVKEEIPKTINK